MPRVCQQTAYPCVGALLLRSQDEKREWLLRRWLKRRGESELADRPSQRGVRPCDQITMPMFLEGDHMLHLNPYRFDCL